MVCGATPSDPSGRGGPVPNRLPDPDADRLLGNPELRERAARQLLRLEHQTKHEVLGSDVVVAELAGLAPRGEERLRRLRHQSRHRTVLRS